MRHRRLDAWEIQRSFEGTTRAIFRTAIERQATFEEVLDTRSAQIIDTASYKSLPEVYKMAVLAYFNGQLDFLQNASGKLKPMIFIKGVLYDHKEWDREENGVRVHDSGDIEGSATAWVGSNKLFFGKRSPSWNERKKYPKRFEKCAWCNHENWRDDFEIVVTDATGVRYYCRDWCQKSHDEALTFDRVSRYFNERGIKFDLSREWSKHKKPRLTKNVVLKPKFETALDVDAWDRFLVDVARVSFKLSHTSESRGEWWYHFRVVD